jgi:hypothetical protein
MSLVATLPHHARAHIAAGSFQQSTKDAIAEPDVCNALTKVAIASTSASTTGLGEQCGVDTASVRRRYGICPVHPSVVLQREKWAAKLACRHRERLLSPRVTLSQSHALSVASGP